MRSVLSIALLSGVAMLAPHRLAPSVVAATASPALSASATALPLVFETIPLRAGAFVARGAGYRFQFDATGMHARVGTGDGARQFSMAVSDRAVVPQTASHPAGRATYFIGADARRWATDLPMYDRVIYPQVQPGIDVVFYGVGRQLEYDLVIAPGTDPHTARLRFDGVEDVRVAPDGELVLTVGSGEFRQSPPQAYQTIDGVRRQVRVGYTVTGHAAGFTVGEYDRRHPLVIDPVLLFSTFFGGTGSDVITSVAVDDAGATYVTGITESADFPGTGIGAASPRFVDAFVTKLDRNGRIVYSSFFGGGDVDHGLSIAVDKTGAPYVFGATTSRDFPTTAGAFQRMHGGDYMDAFVMKLNAAGNRLVYSTYFGGSGQEPLPRPAITVDAGGNAYFTSASTSPDLPVTAGVVDPTRAAGGQSAFVAKLNATGTALLFNTYLTGDRQEVRAIAVDAENRVVVGGHVTGLMRTTHSAGPLGGWDAFVMKLNAGATNIVYSTRIGGTADEEVSGIALDWAGAPHLAGATASDDFPVEPDYTVQPSRKGMHDAFVAGLWEGGTLQYATYLGGSAYDQAVAIDVTDIGIVTVTGETISNDFPVRDAVQQTRGGGVDGWVAQIYGGYRLRFSTYLGGAADDRPWAMDVDSTGAITVGGDTQSANYPLKNAVRSTGPNGPGHPSDGFVTRLAMVPRGTPGAEDIVVNVAEVSSLHGNWVKVTDPTAAGGVALRNPDGGLAKVTPAKANPTDYFEFPLDIAMTGEYRVWLRGKADRDSYNNDSVYLQFSFADEGVDEGRQLFPIGSTEGMAIVLENCNGCGVHGWTWQDDAYGPEGRSQRITFYPGRSPVTVRVQRREDGITIDQIVFAKVTGNIDATNEPLTYWAPGYQRDDDTVLDSTSLPPAGEITMWTADAALNGAWRRDADSSAAGGTKARHPDAGAAKLAAPLARPVNYLELTFNAVANVPYRLWLRGRADADHWNNDSVYVQFSGSVTGAGAPQWRIGSTSATTVVLEECTGCGVRGWGWQDNAYGTGVDGPLVYFAESGPQILRIQTREDGLSIDQVVLSAGRYLHTAPGATKNDGTILSRRP